MSEAMNEGTVLARFKLELRIILLFGLVAGLFILIELKTADRHWRDFDEFVNKVLSNKQVRIHAFSKVINGLKDESDQTSRNPVMTRRCESLLHTGHWENWHQNGFEREIKKTKYNFKIFLHQFEIFKLKDFPLTVVNPDTRVVRILR